ncbi:MAG: Ig-like domain-containing protein, partial [Stackebrandtia sp.]
MRISRFFPWQAARAFVAAAAVLGVLLLIGGMAKAAGTVNTASPGGTLQIINSMAPAVTTTTLTASPVSPVAQGTMVTLNAAVTPATAAGAVQFKDGTTDLGSPAVVRNGTASGTISQLAVGSRQLTAVFTPSDPVAFGASTSPAVTFVVVAASPPGPAATSTALTTSPASPVAQGTAVTQIATVTPAAAAGTVQFKDGTTDLGSPATVSDGTASQTTLLAVGSHQLTAMFTPADPAAFSASMSPAVPVTVTAPQTVNSQAQQSGQSLDGGATAPDAGGLTVLDLDGTADNNGGLTVLDLDGAADNNGGLTVLD